MERNGRMGKESRKIKDMSAVRQYNGPGDGQKRERLKNRDLGP